MTKRLLNRLLQSVLWLPIVLGGVIPAHRLAQASSLPPGETVTQDVLEPTVLSESDLLAPLSSPTSDPALVLQEPDTAGEILAVAVNPSPVTAGKQVAFTVTVRSTGTIAWDPSGITVEVIVVDENGSQVTAETKTDVMAFDGVVPGAEVSVAAFLQVPHDWEGTYGYTLKVWYLATSVDSRMVDHTATTDPNI